MLAGLAREGRLERVAFAFRGKVLPVLTLALKSIGRENITEETLAQAGRVLELHPEESTWRADIAHAPAWIRRVITDIKSKKP